MRRYSWSTIFPWSGAFDLKWIDKHVEVLRYPASWSNGFNDSYDPERLRNNPELLDELLIADLPEHEVAYHKPMLYKHFDGTWKTYPIPQPECLRCYPRCFQPLGHPKPVDDKSSTG